MNLDVKFNDGKPHFLLKDNDMEILRDQPECKEIKISCTWAWKVLLPILYYFLPIWTDWIPEMKFSIRNKKDLQTKSLNTRWEAESRRLSRVGKQVAWKTTKSS